MTNPFLILSPCGTSLLTNRGLISHSDPDGSLKLSDKLRDYANTKCPTSINSNDRHLLESHIEHCRSALLNASVEKAAQLSAEINPLTKFYENGIQRANPRDMHVVIPTDTWLGITTREIITKWLENQKIMVFPFEPIGGLRPDNIDSFHAALTELVQWCNDTLPGFKREGYNIVFNLTGGFKSIQGFLQTLAMFYADESIYLFESRDELMRLPRLPVKLTPEQEITDNIDIFRYIEINEFIPFKRCSGISNTLFFKIDNMATLSPWGNVIWNNSKKDIYGERLLASPDDQIIFEQSFWRSTKDLDADRYYNLNTRIDDLAKYLRNKRQVNLKRLDYKRLDGKPHPSATHEFDAWADLDAKRVFCREEGNNIVLIELAPGYH